MEIGELFSLVWLAVEVARYARDHASSRRR
jgi:hypothetical protein